MKYLIICCLSLTFLNTNGQFADPVIIDNAMPFDNGFTDFQTGDFDGDGDKDIVVDLYFGRQLGWYENLGDNTFGRYRKLFTAQPATYIAVGDLNGDNKADIVGFDFTYLEWKIVVYYSNGIELEEAVIYEFTSGAILENIQLHDMNYDGLPDIVYKWECNTDCAAIVGEPSFFDRVDVIYNNGSGSFSTPYTIAQGSFLDGDFAEIKIVDLNSDGFLDLVTFYNDIQAFYLDQDNEVIGQQTTTTGWPVYFQVVNMNQDSLLDIFYTEPDPGYLLQNVDGTFSGPYLCETVQNVNDEQTYTIIDIDSDGDTDFLESVDINCNDTHLWLHTNDGLVFNSHEVSDVFHWNIEVLLSTDFNEDGHTDIIFEQSGIYRIGYFSDDYFMADNLLGERFFPGTNIVVGDVDNDGDDDICYHDGAPSGCYQLDVSDVCVYENAGDGTFGHQQRSFIATQLDVMQIFDATGDGLNEIVAPRSANYIAIVDFLPDTSIYVHTPITGLYDECQGAPVDQDLDGDMDLMSVSNNRIVFCINQGDSTFFAQYHSTPVGSGFVGAVAGDLDGDLDIDVAVRSSDNKLFIARQESNGLYTYTLDEPSGIYSTPKLMDLDGDNDLDMLVLFGPQFKMYMNDGNAIFTLNGNLAIDPFEANGSLDVWAEALEKAAVFDYDLDGDNDLVFSVNTSSGDQALYVYEVSGSEIHGVQQIQTEIFIELFTGMLDGDEYPDIVLLTDNGFEVLLNRAAYGCMDELACNYVPTAIYASNTCTYPSDGDLDCSGTIDEADLAQLLSDFGCYGQCGYSDLTNDGIVGMDDVYVIISLLE